MSIELRNSIDGIAIIIVAAGFAYATSEMPEEPAGFPAPYCCRFRDLRAVFGCQEPDSLDAQA